MTATPDLRDPATYTFFQTENVRFSDTDMVGHVNNVAHTALVECGRIAYIRSLTEQLDVPFDRVMFVRLELDFLADLFYPSQVTIGARALAVGTSSFTIGTAVFAGDACVNTARNVMVHIGGDKRAAPIPADLRALLEGEIG